MNKFLLIFSAAAVIIAQCSLTERPAGPVSSGENGKGSFSCKVNMTTAPASVTSLRGYLYQQRDSISGLSDTVPFNFVLSGSYATAQVNNLAPGMWVTTINAYNTRDSLLYTGTQWVDVVSGQTSNVSIKLGPAQGSVNFYVYWDTGTVNNPPQVSIYTPNPGQYFKPKDTVIVNAWASDSDGTIAKVVFYRDSGIQVAVDTVAPYSTMLRNLTLGQHAVYAVAYDNKGAQTGSMQVPFVVSNTLPNQPPSVFIASPVVNQYFKPKDTVFVSAIASDSDGTVASVVFYRDSVNVTVDSVAPYSMQLRNLALGNHEVYAVAYDNQGAQTASMHVPFVVANTLPNQPPSVYISSPSANQSFKPTDTVVVCAIASDSDGTIRKVAFYRDSMLVAVDSIAP